MRLYRLVGAFLALIGMVTAADAATLLQGGPWVPGHAPVYSAGGGSQPVVQDGGPAGGGGPGVGLSEGLYVMRGAGTPPFADTGTGPSGTNLCNYDAPITNPTGYHYLCLSPNAGGGGLILYGNGGGAPVERLTINANGVARTFPWGLIGPPTTVVGNLALWGDTFGGSLTSVPMSGDCTINLNGTITCTKVNGQALGTMAFQNSGAVAITGGTLNGGPIGTMANQNASSVAITGGSITGMPNPSNASDVVTKSYADGLATGLKILAPSALATTGVLPNSPTYSNGTLGVGATLTAGSNSTLTVDGVVAGGATVVLVKNQAAPAQNGIYSVTQAGSGSTPWILTRVTYFDQAAEMLSQSYTFVTSGDTLIGSSYVLTTTVATVGTDPANFNLFASSSYVPNAVAITGGSISGVTLATSAATITGGTISGATLTGNTISGGTITGLLSPSASSDAATKGYVDTKSGFTLLASGFWNGISAGTIIPNCPTCRGYKIELYEVASSVNNNIIYLKLSSNGGASYDSGVSDYASVAVDMSGNGIVPITFPGSAIQLSGSTINNAGTGLSEEITIMGVNANVAWPMVAFEGTYLDSSFFLHHITGSGERRAAQITNAFQVFPGSGGLFFGSYAIYGLQ